MGLPVIGVRWCSWPAPVLAGRLADIYDSRRQLITSPDGCELTLNAGMDVMDYSPSLPNIMVMM